MSDMLSIGASGVRAYQTALTTVSDNIANTGTTGYTRRSADMREIAPASSIAGNSAVSVGNGVLATGISRSVDQFRAADVRSASADLARSETGIDWLGRVQSALTGNQLGDRLTSFFTSANAVAADPTATTPRSAMLEAASSAASSFAATGTALDNVAATLDATADNATTTLDSLGAALAKVNDGLGRSAEGSGARASLLDQRDQLLEQMSAIADVNVTTDTAGRSTVRLGGATGPVFVAGSEAGSVSYARGDSGAVSFAVHRAGTSATFSPTGGALAGVVDAAARVTGARDQLNAIATDFAAGVNAVQAQGRDLDGNAGAAMFTAGATPTDLSVSLTDPRGIAAAAVGGGPRDNSNLVAFASLRGSGGFEASTTALISDTASTLAARQQVADAQSAIRDGAVAARDNVSGVNLDSEAVDLMRFQQAYSASSRVIQVARETFQSILDIR
ncbi:MAG TPA: flagellar hook-associated protein FlgK [Sphingomonas sp.]|nr:flagellar hook-associated protein FlgK [Sphingomonas sp.]